MKLTLGDKFRRNAEPEEGAEERAPRKFGLKPRQKNPKKKPSYPRKARFSLLIGDEGAILIYMKGNTVLSRQFVPDASPANLAELRRTIDDDRQAPITMIIDSVDQSFAQQTLPPVSKLSVQKLVKRRLERDFKATDIKGAIVLDREKGGRRDWNFLMVSVEKSPQMILWLDFVMTFENRFRGIVLLSAEAGIFIRQLERSLGIVSRPGAGDAEWKILVSHNKVGGFRQIILHKGNLIFTRLALPVGEPAPEVIAGHIEQEMLSTIEYLKRFGFNAKAGLDVYIIASQSVCALVDSRRFEAQSFYTFSPHQIAQQLGIKGATQPTDQFGDVVLASSIGSIRQNVLKLATPESQMYDKYQLVKLGQRMVGTFAILGMIIYTATIGYGTLIARSNFQDYEQKQRISQQALEAVKQSIKESSLDINHMSDRIDIYRQIKSERRVPHHFIRLLEAGVKSPVKIDNVRWQLGGAMPREKVVPNFPGVNLDADPNNPPPAANDGVVREPVAATVALIFPAGLKSSALFKKFSETVLDELKQTMPNYVIAYTGIPQEYLDTRSLQMNFDQKPLESTLGLGPVMVEVTIYGLMPVLPEEEGPL